MRGLVVGRFQPFHNGHLALLKAAREQCVDVVVGIGSSAAKPGLRNPFSFEERKAMVDAAAPGLRIVAIPDIHDPPRWVDHVLAITGPIDIVYGNDDATLDLFDLAGLRTARPGLVDRERLEGSRLRVLMAEDDPAWRRAVPAPVVKLLDSYQASRRLRGLEALA